jgi:alanine racemase
MTVKQSYRCWAEVDLSALRENLGWIRHRVGPGVRVMTVVKADAYGHGLKQIAALLMQSGTDVFGVANLAEAHAIRSVGKGWPILMLGACLPHEVETAVRDQVSVTVSSLEEGERLSTAATRLGRQALLHLKIDTGMGRLGARPSDAPKLLAALGSLPGLLLQGLYTHFSSAESDARFTQHQREAFQTVLVPIVKSGRNLEYIHANNSAGVLLEPESVFNTVRPGLLAYGIIPPGTRRVPQDLKHQLRPALSWKCRVSLLKTVPANSPLSYGQIFRTRKAMRVATITAGYGDGYMRSGSDKALVLIHGKRCPILGRITMDQMIVDVSRVPGVQTGDEVALLGRQGKAEIKATELAEWFGTIPWEVLTNITYRVPRVYLGGHAA